ncbi:hypothetical protein NLJ89_g10075 [Agrocybe chaxingu]|uniref:Uncharacterized protein n=1 Tax=Agrocybe chaxingu TaxID=84603 RepID=A0A9W8MQM0_9AGAR|nr:hypothetical protein NLJ89_g10075 [Agrocybe chaxingu]
MPPPTDAVHKFFDDDQLVERMVLAAPFQALPPLLLTSKSMNKHVVPAVWRVLPSSIHLLKLIPGLYVRSGKWSLPSSLTRSDLRRFEYYSQFVFEVLNLFSTTCDGPSNIDANVFRELALFGATVFPKLRRLTLPSNGDHQLSTPFFHRALQVADLTLRQHSLKLIDDLITFSPTICSLSLRGCLPPAVLHRTFELRRLTTLKLFFDRHPASYGFQYFPIYLHAFLCDLVALQHLSTLVLILPKACIYKMRQLPRHSLSGVRCLELRAHIDVLQRILSASYDLVEVIIVPYYSSDLDCHATMTSLADTSRNTLRSLTYSASTCIDFSFAFSPLRPASNITEINLLGSTILQDNDIRNVVDMWPLLQHFVTPIQQDSVSALTLRAVGHLTNLQHLHVLRIQIADHILIWPPSSLAMSHTVCGTNLACHLFGDSCVTEQT